MSIEQDNYIPYGRHEVSKSDIKSVLEVLESSFLTQGTKVPLFEEKIAKKVNSAYAIAVNSATSALHLACLALDLGPGDLLWTSAITFVASANCGRYCGADIDFIDIDPFTGLISLQALEEKLKRAKIRGSLPKIVIPVHLGGSSCDMEELYRLSKVYGFFIIEDASHAIGGKYKDEPVGNCKYSSITIFSFHPVKIITSAEGGIATTNDNKLAEKMLDLRSHGIVKELSRFELENKEEWKYEQQYLGFNYRLSDLHAALGISQLSRLDSIILERNNLYSVYKKELANLPVSFLRIPINVVSSIHLFIIRLNCLDPIFHRKIFRGLREKSIGVQLHYNPVHLNPYYRNLGFKEGMFPESELYSRNAITLPLFPGLTYNDQKRICETLGILLAAYNE